MPKNFPSRSAYNNLSSSIDMRACAAYADFALTIVFYKFSRAIGESSVRSDTHFSPDSVVNASEIYRLIKLVLLYSAS